MNFIGLISAVCLLIAYYLFRKNYSNTVNITAAVLAMPAAGLILYAVIVLILRTAATVVGLLFSVV